MESSLEKKIAKTWEKCEEALREMEVLLSGRLYGGSISRAYYAMFHATCAILLTKDLEFSRHSAVISAFGHKFVRTGIIETAYHKMLTEAFEARQIAEYDIFKQIDKGFANKIADNAREFTKRIEQYLSISGHEIQ